jgi:ATP-dependent Clp protease ATP-binding subunit ClpA
MATARRSTPFLALLEQPKGLVSEIIERLGAPVLWKERQLTPSTPRRRTRDNPQAVAQVFITPRLKRVIDQATEEARTFQDEYISTEHLLLGALGERGGFTAGLLREARITRDGVEIY